MTTMFGIKLLPNFRESANARWLEVGLRKFWPQEHLKKTQPQNTV